MLYFYSCIVIHKSTRIIVKTCDGTIELTKKIETKKDYQKISNEIKSYHKKNVCEKLKLQESEIECMIISFNPF